MSVYFTDIVRITNITADVDGAETKGTPFNSKAYVEIDDEIRYGNDGQPIAPKSLVVLPKGTSISNGDLIKVVKLHGETVTGIDAVDKKARIKSRVGGFTISHVEVFI